jgi:very-short-patch-repair endonuclease
MLSVLRRLARDQWVRLHGTPREIWRQWLALSGVAGTLLEATAGAADAAAPPESDGALDEQIRAAVARAAAEPAHPIAVAVGAEAAQRWRAGRRDRLAAMVDEGWLAVPDEVAGERGASPPPVAAVQVGGSGSSGAAALEIERRWQLDARSIAEATLFEALEATPATAGRFQLNESLAVRFGPVAAEIDLLSRGDRIAIEIDGVHHFADLERYRRDRRKDLLLQTHGFVVVRLLADDVVRDVRAAVTVVSQALAYRLGEGRG